MWLPFANHLPNLLLETELIKLFALYGKHGDKHLDIYFLLFLNLPFLILSLCRLTEVSCLSLPPVVLVMQLWSHLRQGAPYVSNKHSLVGHAVTQESLHI